MLNCLRTDVICEWSPGPSPGDAAALLSRGGAHLGGDLALRLLPQRPVGDDRAVRLLQLGGRRRRAEGVQERRGRLQPDDGAGLQLQIH